VPRGRPEVQNRRLAGLKVAPERPIRDQFEGQISLRFEVSGGNFDVEFVFQTGISLLEQLSRLAQGLAARGGKTGILSLVWTKSALSKP
jgi:hypothetical protein